MDPLVALLAELGLSPEHPPAPAAWRALLRRLGDAADPRIRQRERYLEAVVDMQSRLLSTPGDHLGAFNHALEPLGLATGASRVYIFENHIDPTEGILLTSQRAEWCAPGVTPEIDNTDLQGLPFDALFPEWCAALRAGQRIERLACDFNEAEGEVLGPQGILSLLVLPLTVDGALTGFIGFDNCTAAVPWSHLEISLLTAAAAQISLILAQRRAQRELEGAHAAVAEARDRALEANRAKTVFLAKISHELRTPLNAIHGYTELLLEADDLDPAQRRQDLERIQGASRHLVAVISDLLDLARADAEQLTLYPAAIDLNGLVDDVIAAGEHLARRYGLRFVTELDDLGGHFASDRTRVHQILLNLLTNAFKYTRAGEVRLIARGSPEHLEFQVRDTGIGIDPQHLQRIFDAFAQVDDSPARSYDGAGLGLAISRHLCQLLRGRLEVASTVGEGSCFTLTLPRDLPPPETPSARDEDEDEDDPPP